MTSTTMRRLLAANIEWMYTQAARYHVEDPQELVHNIVVKVLEKEAIYAKAPEDLPQEEFRKWFSAYIYWMFRDGQRETHKRLQYEAFSLQESRPGHEGSLYFNNVLAVDGDVPAYVLADSLDAAFKQFEEPFRTQLRGILAGDLTLEEFATQAKLSYTAAKTKVHRAKKRLQSFLKQHYFDEAV